MSDILTDTGLQSLLQKSMRAGAVVGPMLDRQPMHLLQVAYLAQEKETCLQDWERVVAGLVQFSIDNRSGTFLDCYHCKLVVG